MFSSVRSRIAALFFVLSVALPLSAFALTRVTWYFQTNPPSTWFNLWERDQRLGEGSFWWNALSGANTSYAGTFDNLSVVPVTGLYVAVGPTNSSFVGTLYQLVADDTSAWGGYPQGVGSSALPADSTKVVGQGTLQANTANIGPLTAGYSSGQSVIDLIECNLTPSTDQTSSTVNLVNPNGSSNGTATVNRDRVDAVGCTFKASASSSSPTVPTVDSGYVAIGYVTVPYGTSVVTSGMITAESQFSGFAAPSPSGVLPIAEGGTNNSSPSLGCMGYNGTYIGHLSCLDTAGTGLTSSGTTVALSTPVSVANGGTGTSSPTGVSCSNGISCSGSFPSQSVSLNNYNNYSTNANGYTYLPNGFIIQWGTVSSTAGTYSASASFPIAFPNVALSMSVSPTQLGNCGGSATFGQVAAAITSRSGFSYTTGGCTSGDSDNFTYVAIGY